MTAALPLVRLRDVRKAYRRGAQVVFGETREYHVQRVKPELAAALAAALRLHLPEQLAFLAGEHLQSRLDQLTGVAGLKTSEIVTG